MVKKDHLVKTRPQLPGLATGSLISNQTARHLQKSRDTSYEKINTAQNGPADLRRFAVHSGMCRLMGSPNRCIGLGILDEWLNAGSNTPVLVVGVAKIIQAVLPGQLPKIGFRRRGFTGSIFFSI